MQHTLTQPIDTLVHSTHPHTYPPWQGRLSAFGWPSTPVWSANVVVALLAFTTTPVAGAVTMAAHAAVCASRMRTPGRIAFPGHLLLCLHDIV